MAVVVVDLGRDVVVAVGARLLGVAGEVGCRRGEVVVGEHRGAMDHGEGHHGDHGVEVDRMGPFPMDPRKTRDLRARLLLEGVEGHGC